MRAAIADAGKTPQNRYPQQQPRDIETVRNRRSEDIAADGGDEHQDGDQRQKQRGDLFDQQRQTF
jgi:hypothetical protein